MHSCYQGYFLNMTYLSYVDSGAAVISFSRHSKEPPKPKEEADSVMQQLMTVVQYTAVSIILPLLKVFNT